MIFTLYIDGESEKSLVAQVNLQRLCEQHLGDECVINIVDVAVDPRRAVKAQIIALPTLEIEALGKRRRLVGDLSLAPAVIAAFGMVKTSRRMLDDSRACVERAVRADSSNRSRSDDDLI